MSQSVEVKGSCERLASSIFGVGILPEPYYKTYLNVIYSHLLYRSFLPAPSSIPSSKYVMKRKDIDMDRH